MRRARQAQGADERDHGAVVGAKLEARIEHLGPASGSEVGETLPQCLIGPDSARYDELA